ncbi:MAG: bifunctional UDP-N-acetylglucosamine diphosphorylase/glucosamine-1-phosphate N-acetyltransferase GlmU [Mariprofundaceae bacterium]
MNQYADLEVIVLAAGQGKRMLSSKPKVLHELLGKSMLAHVLTSIEGLSPQGIALVVGHGSSQVRDVVEADHHVSWVEQQQQLGTAHAVLQCESVCGKAAHVLVVCGDTPLLRTETLQSLLDSHIQSDSDISFLSAVVGDATGYGRVCRNDKGEVTRIVEQRDACDDVLAIDEVSSGIFCVKQDQLFGLLKKIGNDNDQQEYYLPDMVPLALANGGVVQAYQMADPTEMQGINDRTQLRFVCELMQQRVILDWEKAGVCIEQPNTVRIDTSVHVGMDTIVRAGTQLLGNTHIGDGCELGPYAVIDQSWLDDGVKVHAFSHLEKAHMSSTSQAGPYARLRPETKLDEGVKIGNFVEIKKSIIGKNSKVNHLSYIGDTLMGESCNIGAGTITCNYDGANKHQTVMGDNVFIGSDTKLVAPVEVFEGATVGAGSIITKSVKANGLTLSARPEQRYIKDWMRPQKG